MADLGDPPDCSFICQHAAPFHRRLEAISQTPPEEDNDTSELYHTQEVLRLVLVTDYQPPEVGEPGEETLDLPTSLVAPELASILSLSFLPVLSVRSNQLDALLKQGLIERLRVVSLVSYQTLGLLFQKAPCQSRFNKGDLVW